MLGCVLDNYHFLGERREMSTQSLPAASLRTGNRLPAGRARNWVSKYLIWTALSSICSSIRRDKSISLPALREAPGSHRRGPRAGSSGRVVGGLALAQHHPGPGPGGIENPAQRADSGAPAATKGRAGGVDL